MRSDETQRQNIAPFHRGTAADRAVDVEGRAPNPMRHKIRAGGSTRVSTTKTNPKKAKDDLMVGRWAVSYTSKSVRYSLVTIAFLLDMLLHIAVGAAVWYFFDQFPEPPWHPITSGVLAGLAASFVHRTFVQRVIRTTLGKALFGLRLLRKDGSYPTLGQLIKQWFIGVLAMLEAAVTIG